VKNTNRSIIVCCVALGLLAPGTQGATIDIGALSYDTFIPAIDGAPGVDAFDIANLTGPYSLVPDFPVIDSLTFQSAILTLTLSDSSKQVFDLGDIAPGFLLDGGGNPVVQVPTTETFSSAEFTATLSPTAFTLSGPSPFQAYSPSLDIFLLPTAGPALTADLDGTIIDVSNTAPSTVPEPPVTGLVVSGLLCVAFRLQQHGRGKGQDLA
jgi:hypothetical protein